MPSYDANGAIRGITRRYYAVWLIYSLAGGFLFGVYPIFLHSRGLNQFEINSVLAAYFVVLFLTDVPTGAFADALGQAAIVRARHRAARVRVRGLFLRASLLGVPGRREHRRDRHDLRQRRD